MIALQEPKMPIQEHAQLSIHTEAHKLALALRRRAPSDAFALLGDKPDDLVVAALMELDTRTRRVLLERFPTDRQTRLRALDERIHALPEAPSQNEYGDDTIGHLMTLPEAVFPLGAQVDTIVERVRVLDRQHIPVIYAYVVDDAGKLQGLVTMRDLLLATPQAKVDDIMLHLPFSLHPQMTVEDAMHETARRHYPIYPVCNEQGHLIGTVSGAALFEARAYEISAQSGQMVGVNSEERLLTPWKRSLRLRHPWLLVNLMTGLVVGFIVSRFNGTLSQLVILTAFLPILSSVAGNTGCQTLAVTLRGIALDEYQPGNSGKVLRKEMLLGATNGAAIGLVAGVVMFAYGLTQHAGHPLLLAVVVMAAMTGACLAGGMAGVAVPTVLRRFGADPATASSIFLTTTTDIVGMTLFLGLATALLM